jgi:hypothetical protein
MQFNEFAPPIGNHTTLNPKLWDHDRLKGEVRGALLRIAEDFLEFIEVPVKVLDIVIAGGNANYTYTNKSDIDLHIIADYSQITCDREVEELFDTKRLLYKQEHDLTIKSIPVELYVEDYRTPAVSAAYSIIKEKWIRPPKKQFQKYDQKTVKHMASVWRTVLRHSIKTGDLDSCRATIKLLRTYRQKGLHTAQGEYSIPNLVYKSLRNDHTLTAITTLINKLHDRKLSI